ncbi:MAG: hypothetical protein K8W52_34555 [Deltaproteobacteria bacterium]|nr:hypothetical protein [Deltaproteobacteria bacterium]
MLRVCVLVAVLVSVGCSSGPPRRIGEAPSWRGGGAERPAPTPAGPPQPLTFTPPSASSPRYNDPPVAPAPSSPIGDAVVAAVAREADNLGIAHPVPDGRLFAAADELAAVVPEEGVVPYALVEFAIQHHGIVEPSPHLLVVWGPLDDSGPIVEQLAPRIPELLRAGASSRVGIGTARRGDQGVVILALQGSSVDTAAIPRTLPQGGTIHIDGRLREPFKNPEVFVTADDGTVSRPAVQEKDGSFHAAVECPAAPARQQIEIVGFDASGATVLANFPVWCREAPPTQLTILPDTDDTGKIVTEHDAEQTLFALVNRDRKRAGLAELTWDEGLAEVARGHSREMRTTGVIAHISPTTGNAADRVRVAGIRTGVVLENIARAYSVMEAHQGLMNSPGHRANLMSSVATHLGVGILFGDEISGQRELFVTQVFIRVPPTIDPQRAKDDVRALLRKARPALGDDADLAKAAQGLADDLAHGAALDAARLRATHQLDGHKYTRVGSVVTAVAELDSLSAESLLGTNPVNLVGVGIAQGPHPDLGDKAIWLVLLLAERAH